MVGYNTTRVQKFRLFLASGSPRRARLLREAGFEFEVIRREPHTERRPQNLPPGEYVEAVALAKAADIAADGVVLGADTVAAQGDRILGKPRDRLEAFLMLRGLSGTTHQVLTGVALVCGGRTRVFHEVSRVTLGPLTDEQIRRYHRAVDPLDKAGACDVDEPAGVLDVRIEGSRSNVVGLPIERLRNELTGFLG